MNNNYHKDKEKEVRKPKSSQFGFKSLIIFVIAVVAIVLLVSFSTKDENNQSDVVSSEETLETSETSKVNGSTQINTSVPSTAVSTSPKVSIAPDGAFIVRLTDDGFVPKILQIQQMSVVRFINDSDKAMRIFADEDINQTHISIKQPKSVGRGETYDVRFTRAGVWFYNNQNLQVDVGNITVF